MTACSPQALENVLDTVAGGGSGGTQLSTAEVAAGLKQALEIGSNNASGFASKTNGFFGNQAIKILFPPEAQKVEKTIRDLGMNKLADDFILSVNRSAEDASKKAAPIFINAIKQMSIQDAWGILKGGESAATEYLKRTTTAQLQNAFRPVITESLKKPLLPGTNLNAYKSWADVTGAYNKIPLTKPVNTDLTNFVTEKALEGVFHYVALEEGKIRKDPLARTTELLKKVFSQQ